MWSQCGRQSIISYSQFDPAYSLGLIKLAAGTLAPRPSGEITITRETGVSAKIDGGQRVGMVIMRKAVDIAVQKAKVSGMSVVGVTNYASATGALGVWGRDIARSGLIGIVMSQVNLSIPYCSALDSLFEYDARLSSAPNLYELCPVSCNILITML